MMLIDLKEHLYSSGIFDDYEAHSYFGINDSQTSFLAAEKWTAFKTEGGSRVDPIYGQPIIRLWVGGATSNQLSRYEDIQSTIDFVNANFENGCIADIMVESDVHGPFPLSGDRTYFEIFLRLNQAR